MKEYPALFNGAMVRKIGTGEKTQTRRLVKGGPNLQHYEKLLGEWPLSKNLGRVNGQWKFQLQTDVDDFRVVTLRSPYGMAGDRIWVREAFMHEPAEYEWLASVSKPIRPEHTTYRADCHGDTTGAGWSPSIHMPRWASRYLLDVLAVRVERLQDISEEDARAEGVEGWAKSDDGLAILSALGFAVPTAPRFLFQLLWISVYGAESWDENPWVWVTTFKLVSP